MFALNGYGVATQFFDKTSPYVQPLAFFLFAAVGWHVLELHFQVGDLNRALANRAQRRLIRKALDRFAERYHPLL
jgi:hypothetical protein